VAPATELSPDGSHAFVETQSALAGELHTEGHGLATYEWTAEGGLHPVGVNNLGEPLSSCGAALAGEAPFLPFYPNVSQNGRRVFIESPDPQAKADGGKGFGCSQPSELYVRENGSTTTEISKAPAGAAECEPGVTECEATFVGASADGSRVFFVTRSQLTPDKATADPDLYEYNVERHALTRLSVGPPGYDDADVALPDSTGTGFSSDNAERSVIVSSDGSHVYFTGRGQLVPGVGATKASNESNDTVNLYAYAKGTISFIATIEPGTWSGISNAFPDPEAPLSVRVAQVTPDGSDLLFDTRTRLTGYDSEARGELYRYDAPTHTIACVSCNPSLAPPGGPLDPTFHTNFWDGPHGAVQQFGGLSNDGDTVFFASTDELLPAAANVLERTPRNPIYDIYEWHAGVLSLISSGTSASSDFLLGSSSSGSDVYFMSGPQLVPQDGESGAQIYDARLEGGFPASAAPAPCTSPETCRSVAATPPVTVSPATVSVSGPGNVTTVTGSESAPPTIVKKTETRSEKLKTALKACRRDKRKTKRVSCEKAAQKHYGPVVKRKVKKK
jgi:hypothetical protein